MFFIIFSEMETSNPWLVDSIEAFYCIKCPECDFDTKEEIVFQDHAVENHPLSFVLFGKSEENIVDSSAQDYTDFYETENEDLDYNAVEDQQSKKVIKEEPKDHFSEDYLTPSDPPPATSTHAVARTVRPTDPNIWSKLASNANN